MYTLLRKKHFLVVLLSTLFLLAACGYSGQATQSPHATVPPSMVQNTPAPTGSVVVTVNKTQYLTSDTVAVTITNNLSTSIYASSYYTNCTPAQLEVKSAASWAALGQCPEATTSALAIEPGGPKAFLLHPSTGPMVSRVGSGGTWTPGTYRIAFNYTLQPDPDTSRGGIGIVSGEFTIIA